MCVCPLPKGLPTCQADLHNFFFFSEEFLGTKKPAAVLRTTALKIHNSILSHCVPRNVPFLFHFVVCSFGLRNREKENGIYFLHTEHFEEVINVEKKTESF